MSRVPRFQEHLKTGFMAEAASAARYRAYSAQAREEGHQNLAERWLELAAEKDRLAIEQLRASGRVNDGATSIRDAIAEENYENDILYPKMMRDVEGTAAEVFQRVLESQKSSLATLATLRRELQASSGDIG